MGFLLILAVVALGAIARISRNPKLAAHIVKHDDGTTSHEAWLKSVAGIDAPKLVEPPKDMTDDDLVAVQHNKAPIVIYHE